MLSIVILMVAMTGFAYIPADVGPPETENAALFKDVLQTPAIVVINQQIDLEATDVGIPSQSYDVIEYTYNADLSGQTTSTAIVTDVWRQPWNFDNSFNKDETTGYNAIAFIDRHRLSCNGNISS